MTAASRPIDDEQLFRHLERLVELDLRDRPGARISIQADERGRCGALCVVGFPRIGIVRLRIPTPPEGDLAERLIALTDRTAGQTTNRPPEPCPPAAG